MFVPPAVTLVHHPPEQLQPDYDMLLIPNGFEAMRRKW